jgi:hypothetical protein
MTHVGSPQRREKNTLAFPIGFRAIGIPRCMDETAISPVGSPAFRTAVN